MNRGTVSHTESWFSRHRRRLIFAAEVGPLLICALLVAAWFAVPQDLTMELYRSFREGRFELEVARAGSPYSGLAASDADRETFVEGWFDSREGGGSDSQLVSSTVQGAFKIGRASCRERV